MDLPATVEAIMRTPGPVRLVAVDGPGGAGKSTFADRLARAAGGAPVVHTDDFASADNPLNWWPRLLEQVIVPLKSGNAARFQRYDWSTESFAEWHTIEPAPVVIIEGVSSGRSEWVGHLSYLFWIETPRKVAKTRAINSANVTNESTSPHSAAKNRKRGDVYRRDREHPPIRAIRVSTHGP